MVTLGPLYPPPVTTMHLHMRLPGGTEHDPMEPPVEPEPLCRTAVRALAVWHGHWRWMPADREAWSWPHRRFADMPSCGACLAMCREAVVVGRALEQRERLVRQRRGEGLMRRHAIVIEPASPSRI